MRNRANNSGKAGSTTILPSSEGKGVPEETVHEKSGFPHSRLTAIGYTNSKEAFPDKDPSALYRQILWRKIGSKQSYRNLLSAGLLKVLNLAIFIVSLTRLYSASQESRDPKGVIQELKEIVSHTTISQ